MSVIWLRVAAGLYSLGLLPPSSCGRRREHLFRVALAAFALGSVFHFVSIVEEGIVNHRCPITNFYETLSMSPSSSRCFSYASTGATKWKASACSSSRWSRNALVAPW